MGPRTRKKNVPTFSSDEASDAEGQGDLSSNVKSQVYDYSPSQSQVGPLPSRVTRGSRNSLRTSTSQKEQENDKKVLSQTTLSLIDPEPEIEPELPISTSSGRGRGRGRGALSQKTLTSSRTATNKITRTSSAKKKKTVVTISDSDEDVSEEEEEDDDDGLDEFVGVDNNNNNKTKGNDTGKGGKRGGSTTRGRGSTSANNNTNEERKNELKDVKGEEDMLLDNSDEEPEPETQEDGCGHGNSNSYGDGRDNDDPEHFPDLRSGPFFPSQESDNFNAFPTIDDEDIDDIENTLRIMIATDNHVGYQEKDPIRGNDSVAAFEEIMILARQHKVDFVLLGGDLFHDNKPSRRSLYKVSKILQKHCIENKSPVNFQVLYHHDKCNPTMSSSFSQSQSDTIPQSYTSKEGLPVFIIHGNHDDPTREGGSSSADENPLSALDLLSVNGLVNYFGKSSISNEIKVGPIILKKGSTLLNLYGLGNIRDERLHRMWADEKVQFLRLQHGTNGTNTAEFELHNDNQALEDIDEEEDEEDKPFNLFVLHQNRDTGRGAKNCIYESMIPSFMDLVIWGHEHECIIEPFVGGGGKFYIMQPGSSVATSLCEGESVQKKVCILSIKGRHFKVKPIPLTQVRPFVCKEVALDDYGENLDLKDPDIEETVSLILGGEIEELIRQARAKINEEDRILPTHEFTLKHKDRVLVRLRVDPGRFPIINTQRFGSKFIGEVSNPTELLLFAKKQRTNKRIDGSNQISRNTEEMISALTSVGGSQAILHDLKVEEFIQKELEDESNGLEMKILDTNDLAIALSAFVEKGATNAFEEEVELQLKKSQQKINALRRKKKSETVGTEGGNGDENENENEEDIEELIEEVIGTQKHKKQKKTAKKKSSGKKEKEDQDPNARNNTNKQKKSKSNRRRENFDSETSSDDDSSMSDSSDSSDSEDSSEGSESESDDLEERKGRKRKLAKDKDDRTKENNPSKRNRSSSSVSNSIRSAPKKNLKRKKARKDDSSQESSVSEEDDDYSKGSSSKGGKNNRKRTKLVDESTAKKGHDNTSSKSTTTSVKAKTVGKGRTSLLTKLSNFSQQPSAEKPAVINNDDDDSGSNEVEMIDSDSSSSARKKRVSRKTSRKLPRNFQ